MISLIATLNDIGFDFNTGQRSVTMTVDYMPEELNNMVGKKVKCEVKSYNPGRSLNANALFHLIVSLISDSVGESQAFVKNQLLRDYGQFDTNFPTMLLKDDIDPAEFETIHLKPTGKECETDGCLYREYYVMRGSHTYDSKEMRTLIEGAKRELDQLGIAMPISEAELQRILGKWNARKEGL